MRFVVEIECDTDASMNTARDFRVFADFESAARLFRQLHPLYQDVTPVGRSRALAVIGGRIYKVDSDDDASAITAVKSGTADLINDVTYADQPPSA